MTLTPSKGHVAWSRPVDGRIYEAYEYDGEVYVTDASHPLDIHGYRQGGRWESSRSHFDAYREVVWGGIFNQGNTGFSGPSGDSEYVGYLQALLKKAEEDLQRAQHAYKEAPTTLTKTKVGMVRQSILLLKRKIDEAMATLKGNRPLVTRTREGTTKVLRVVSPPKDQFIPLHPEAEIPQSETDIPVLMNFFVVGKIAYPNPYSVMPDAVIDAFYKWPPQASHISRQMTGYGTYLEEYRRLIQPKEAMSMIGGKAGKKKKIAGIKYEWEENPHMIAYRRYLIEYKKLAEYSKHVVLFSHRGGAGMSALDIYRYTGWSSFVAESRTEEGNVRFKIRVTLASDLPPAFTVEIL